MNEQGRPSAEPTHTEGDRLELSVVVPTKNRQASLIRLLDAVLPDPAVAEVIVIDDGSTDGTAEYLHERTRQDFRLRVTAGPQSGPLRARVVGVQAASKPVVLLLDDDVNPSPGLASGHLAHHRDGVERLVLGYMPTTVPARRSPGDFTTRLYASEYEGRCLAYRQDVGDVLHHLWMGNLSVSRKSFLAATAEWPAPMPAYRHEDTEIGLRLESLGVHPVFDQDLLARHEHHRTLAQFRRDCRLDGAGLAELDRENRTVFGPAGTARFSAGLPAPLSILIAAVERPGVHRASTAVISASLRVAGALHAYRTETKMARLLRRLERHHGYSTAQRRSPGENSQTV